MNVTLLRDSRRRLVFFDVDRFRISPDQVIANVWVGLGPFYIRVEVERISRRRNWRVDWGLMTRRWGSRLTTKGWRVVK